MSELEEFYDEYVEKIYKFFYIKCLDRHLAEDLTSKTWLAFMDKTSSTSIENPKKYLYGIMRNTWSTFLREKYKKKLVDIEEIDDFSRYSESVVEDYEALSLKERAQEYIDRLPRAQQQIAKLRLLEEKTISEIASELNKSTQYVKTTQNRAIKSLKRLQEAPYLAEGGI